MRRFGLLACCAAGGILLASGSFPLAAVEPGVVLLTELVYDPPGEDGPAEWFELANVGPLPVDVGRFIVGDEETPGGGEGLVRLPPGTILPPEGVLVVAQTAVAFRAAYGFLPDFELQESDPNVPNLLPDLDLAEGEIALANGGDELLLFDAEGTPLDGVSYGESDRILRPAAPLAGRGSSLARDPANCDTDSAADWRVISPPTPEEITRAPNCARPEAAGPVLEISQVQGSGPVSPFVGETVTVEGVVVGRQVDVNTRGLAFHTLFLQQPGEPADEAPAGLPVFFGLDRPSFGIGDEIRVSGAITEYFGLTEVEAEGLAIQLLGRGRPLPEPVLLFEAGSGRTAAEPLEGMLVAIAEGRVAGPTYETASGCGFAVTTAAGSPTPLLRHTLETDLTAVLPVIHFDETACADQPALKVGDRIQGLAGPLTYQFDQFRLVQQDPFALRIEPAPLRPLPEPPAAGPNQITLATFNLENFFDDIDDTGDDSEPKPSLEEIAVKRSKIAAAIADILGCPTLIAVQEVEKEALLAELAGELAVPCGFRYEVTHRESFDGRGIDVALLSDPRRAAVEEARLRPACSPVPTAVVAGDCPGGEYPLFSRPPLQVDLLVDGKPLTVLNNHFKSKRGGELETGPERVAQARFIVALLAELAGRPVAVVGDFNDYAESEPLQIMTAGGLLENVLRRLPAADQYSFNFGGVLQLIDGILLTPDLAARVDALYIPHVNADFPTAWGRELGPERLYYRSADHDPPLVRLDWSERVAEEPVPAESPAPAVETAAPAAAPVTPAAAAAVESGLQDVKSGLGGWPWAVIIGGVMLLLGGWFFWSRRAHVLRRD